MIYSGGLLLTVEEFFEDVDQFCMQCETYVTKSVMIRGAIANNNRSQNFGQKPEWLVLYC